MAKQNNNIKEAIERELVSMLDSKGEPNDARMRLLKLGIGYLAVNAKMEEDEYGGFFNSDPDVPAGKEEARPQPRARGRKKRGTDPDPAPGSRDALGIPGFPEFGGPGDGTDEEGVGFATGGSDH